MLSLLRKFLLLNPSDLSSPHPYNWQLSALRIIVFSGICLVFVIAVHSSWQAYQLGFYYIIALTSGFYFSLLLVLYISRRKLFVSAVGLTLIVLMAALCILLFIDDIDLAQYGALFLYSLPLVALLFFGPKAAYFAIACNLVPFLLLVNKQLPVGYFDFSITLPGAHVYVHGLMFLFFNFCIPLATIRILHTLRINSRRLKSLNNELDYSHQLYEEMFDHIAFPTLLCDRQGKILKANALAHSLLNVPDAELLNTRLDEWLIRPPAADASLDAIPPMGIEYQLKRNPQCTILVKEQELTRHQNGVIHLEDISDVKRLASQLSEARQEQLFTNYDYLTQLPSSILFMDMVTDQVKAFNKNNFMLLAIVKICQLKMINHEYGYEFGNRLLKAFTKNVKQQLPDKALFCRLRGVKFVIAIPGDLNTADPQRLSQSLRQLLPSTCNLDDEMVVMDYRIGITFGLTPRSHIETGIEECEIALDQCTAQEACVLFDKAQASQMNSDYHMAQSLRESIQQRQFELWLQPKVNHSGDINGFEALIRWPQLDEIIMPDAFIPLAERLGLIPAISRQVLERAVELLKDWRRVNAGYSLAINLAGAELQDEEFFHELVMLSKESPWLVEKLELEITETHLTMLNPYVNKRLHELKQLGYRLAIDDFGTGHASLAQLIDIPADAIKLDKRFIDKLTSDAQHIKIVYTTLSLAQSLNVELVAEGVENELQYQYLVDMGCQMMQGYYFARPRPAGEWLDRIIAAEGQAINVMRETEAALLVD